MHTLFAFSVIHIDFFVVGCFYKMLHLMFRHFLLFVCANEHFNELFSAERDVEKLLFETGEFTSNNINKQHI